MRLNWKRVTRTPGTHTPSRAPWPDCVPEEPPPRAVGGPKDLESAPEIRPGSDHDLIGDREGGRYSKESALERLDRRARRSLRVGLRRPSTTSPPSPPPRARIGIQGLSEGPAECDRSRGDRRQDPF